MGKTAATSPAPTDHTVSFEEKPATGPPELTSGPSSRSRARSQVEGWNGASTGAGLGEASPSGTGMITIPRSRGAPQRKGRCARCGPAGQLEEGRPPTGTNDRRRRSALRHRSRAPALRAGANLEEDGLSSFDRIDRDAHRRAERMLFEAARAARSLARRCARSGSQFWLQTRARRMAPRPNGSKPPCSKDSRTLPACRWYQQQSCRSINKLKLTNLTTKTS